MTQASAATLNKERGTAELRTNGRKCRSAQTSSRSTSTAADDDHPHRSPSSNHRRRLTINAAAVIPGSTGKMGNARRTTKLDASEGMRPVTASQSETTFPEPRENGASTPIAGLGDDGPGVGRRRRGFRQASHSGCTLRATPISGKRLSPSASIRHDATLYPTCDSGAESSSVTTHDDGPTMRRRGRTDPGTPRHPRFFTRPPPLPPGDAQRSSPNHHSPIFPIWSKKVTISGRKGRRESASFFLPV